MLSVFKDYFSNIAEPKRSPAAASPEVNSEESGSYTEFDLLLSTAYNEFSVITEDLIVELRGPSKLKVAHHIGEFSKKLQIRASVFLLFFVCFVLFCFVLFFPASVGSHLSCSTAWASSAHFPRRSCKWSTKSTMPSAFTPSQTLRRTTRTSTSSPSTTLWRKSRSKCRFLDSFFFFFFF